MGTALILLAWGGDLLTEKVLPKLKQI